MNHNSTTELLDVAPIDLFHGISSHFIPDMPDEFISESIKSQAIDMEFIWVSENGPKGKNGLTAGLTATPTVRFITKSIKRAVTNNGSTPLRTARLWISPLSAPTSLATILTRQKSTLSVTRTSLARHSSLSAGGLKSRFVRDYSLAKLPRGHVSILGILSSFLRT